VEERPGRPGDVGGTYADARRAEETLGWRVKISLGEGLRKTARWYATEEAAPWRDPPPP
jgi:UDP-glucuronate 4-epimerase